MGHWAYIHRIIDRDMASYELRGYNKNKKRSVMKEQIGELVSAFTITLAFFVALFNVIKVILMPKKRKINEMIASFVVGWPVGFLAGWVAVESGVGEKLSIAIGCIFVLIAEKVAIFFLTIDAKQFFTRTMNNLIDKWTK